MAETLSEFVESVCKESHLRVEQDFGGGFVRLKSSEAEKRQAAQDIRSAEDIVIELLRNARDAGARHIFLATQRTDKERTIVVIDDGVGIPSSMQTRIFEPRVTSKLDTARMDKWGMHGRGMALYSVSVNAEEARVSLSWEGGGTAIFVRTNLGKLGEKTDQSTFPHFEVKDGVHAMRGPRNIVRTAAEFALEHRRECAVCFGSATEVAAALYAYGKASTTPSQRAFGSASDASNVVELLAFCVDPEQFATQARRMGLDLSSRSARRVMQGEIECAPLLLDRLQQEAFPNQKGKEKTSGAAREKGNDGRGFKLDARDADALKRAISPAFEDIARRYFLNAGVEPEVRVGKDAIRITIPVEKLS